MVLEVDVGAGLHEQCGDVDVVAVGGVDQGGRAPVVAGVDGCALLQQRADGRGVTALRGLAQRRGGLRALGRGGGAGGGQHREQHEADQRKAGPEVGHVEVPRPLVPGDQDECDTAVDTAADARPGHLRCRA